jgi:hypothetical protein
MAKQAKAVLKAETLEAVTDRGYFNGPEILACHEAGIIRSSLGLNRDADRAVINGALSRALDNLNLDHQKVFPYLLDLLAGVDPEGPHTVLPASELVGVRTRDALVELIQAASFGRKSGHRLARRLNGRNQHWWSKISIGSHDRTQRRAYRPHLAVSKD